MSTEDPTAANAVDDEAQKKPEGDETKPDVLTRESVEQMITSNTDKVRREYSDRIKAKDKEIEDLQKAQMTEAERVEFERKKEADERATERAEFATERLRFKFTKALDAEGLSIGWADFINPATEDDMPSAILTIKERIKAETDRQVQQRFKDAGFEPAGGGGGTPTTGPGQLAELQAAYDQAVKTGNHVLQIQLKNQIFGLQKQSEGA